jgi:hypothetical protein
MLLVLILSISFSFSTFASHIETQIYDIDEGTAKEETLLFLTSGHVIRVKKQKVKRHQWLRISLNDQNKIESFTVIPPTKPIQKISSKTFLGQTPYVPTVIENLDLANTYFHEAQFVEKESQCYNRAHIWSYEWFIKNAINSNKTWLFFTRRYIRKFKFDWWFHVSPSIRVLENGIEKEKIMDVKYARGPIDLKSWTDIFMKDDANCPMVNTYSEYANFPESGSCYTLRTSMYYYQPIDIESKEIWETTKQDWYEGEIKQAYLEAFDRAI